MANNFIFVFTQQSVLSRCLLIRRDWAVTFGMDHGKKAFICEPIRQIAFYFVNDLVLELKQERRIWVSLHSAIFFGWGGYASDVLLGRH